MAKTPARAGADRVALYEALLATHPDIERKGAALTSTSVNGNMFSILTADGTLALRLPTPEREALLKQYKITLFTQYGAVSLFRLVLAVRSASQAGWYSPQMTLQAVTVNGIPRRLYTSSVTFGETIGFQQDPN